MIAAGVTDGRLEAAFAETVKDLFLGPPPWQILRLDEGHDLSASDDPADLYTDCLVVIARDRGINCGQPALHARLIHHAAPKEGDHILHVGAGVGYYTAIMARLAGPSGRVTAIEYEPDLARRATQNLSGYRNVEVRQGDGGNTAFPPADMIYVNAGVTRPADSWLDGLKPGGRLILPLTVDAGWRRAFFGGIDRQGAVFLITKTGTGFDARWISPVAIYPCKGARDRITEKALVSAFDHGDSRKVRRLFRTDNIPAERCWLRSPGFSLTYD
jgi:protein-L-isoaspartate(D-aspartate) O-methyltransferase